MLNSKELGTKGDDHIGRKGSKTLKLKLLSRSLIMHEMINSTDENKKKEDLALKVPPPIMMVMTMKMRK